MNKCSEAPGGLTEEILDMEFRICRASLDLNELQGESNAERERGTFPSGLRVKRKEVSKRQPETELPREGS